VNINDENRKHWDFYFQRVQDRIDQQRRWNAANAQARQDDAIRQFEEDRYNLLREREKANLDFERKVNRNQKKEQKRTLRHLRHRSLFHKFTDAVEHRYENNEEFQRFIDEGIERAAAAIINVSINGYRRWKESAAAETFSPPRAGRPIVDYPVEAVWDAEQKYSYAKGRNKP
jgi:hypothetical protein